MKISDAIAVDKTSPYKVRAAHFRAAAIKFLEELPAPMGSRFVVKALIPEGEKVGFNRHSVAELLRQMGENGLIEAVRSNRNFTYGPKRERKAAVKATATRTDTQEAESKMDGAIALKQAQSIAQQIAKASQQFPIPSPAEALIREAAISAEAMNEPALVINGISVIVPEGSTFIFEKRDGLPVMSIVATVVPVLRRQ